MHLSVHLSVRLPVHLSVRLSVCICAIQSANVSSHQLSMMLVAVTLKTRLYVK